MKKNSSHNIQVKKPQVFVERQNFKNILLDWYDGNGRSLPWRLSNNPYTRWISEIMLQQTTVPTVVPRYEIFLHYFPSLKALSKAPIEKILSLWQGLGYYRRAYNLHHCAEKIMTTHEGYFPQKARDLKKLPGIGDYTSAAIASMAFKEPVLAVDGNIRRILCRLFDIPHDPTPQEIKQYGYTVLCHQRPGDSNEALMDFGSLICTPKKPKCSLCPLNSQCLAHHHQTVHLRPFKKKAPPKKKLYAHFFLFNTPQGILLEKQELTNHPEQDMPPNHASFNNLLKGLWGLPSSPWTSTPLPASSQSFFKKNFTNIGKFTHTFTHISLNVSLWLMYTHVLEKFFLTGAHLHCFSIPPLLQSIQNPHQHPYTFIPVETLLRRASIVQTKNFSQLDHQYPMSSLHHKTLGFLKNFIDQIP